jgi:hypothetical protein
MVVEASNETEISAIVESLPLHEYLMDYTVDMLMFSLTANTEIPHISLN